MPLSQKLNRQSPADAIGGGRNTRISRQRLGFRSRKNTLKWLCTTTAKARHELHHYWLIKYCWRRLQGAAACCSEGRQLAKLGHSLCRGESRPPSCGIKPDKQTNTRPNQQKKAEWRTSCCDFGFRRGRPARRTQNTNSATSYLYKKSEEEKEKKSHFYYLLFYYLFLMLCLYALSRLTSADSHPAQSY